MTTNYRPSIYTLVTKQGPMTRKQIEQATGVTGTPLINVLYNMTRAGQLVKNEEPGLPATYTAGTAPTKEIKGRPAGKPNNKAPAGKKKPAAKPTQAKPATEPDSDFIAAVDADMRLLIVQGVDSPVRRFTTEQTLAIADTIAAHFVTE
jgi:hypothetical protein